MAKFKVGDKVKFKNLFKPERGEETGVVTGYDTKGLVLIRDDDGIKVQASEKLVRLANSVCNARLKVGDRVKVTWNPDDQRRGIVGKTGELLRLSSEGTALVDIDGHEYFTFRAYLKLANSVRNAKFKVGDTVEAIRDRVHKLGVKGTVLKVDADDMVVKWADDGFTASYGIEGNFKNLTKEPKATPEDKMKAELSRSGAGSNPRTAHTWLTRHRRGLVSKYGREVYEKVKREATRGLLNAQNRSTNAIVANARWRGIGTAVAIKPNVQSRYAWLGSTVGKVVRTEGDPSYEPDFENPVTVKFDNGKTENIVYGHLLVTSNSAVANSTNAVVAKAMAMNASDPYLGEKLKLMLAREAVSVSGGGKPSVGDVVFEYRGKKYYVGKDSAHMVKQFADAGLVKMVNSSDKVSANSVVAKALNAVGRDKQDAASVEMWIGVFDNFLSSQAPKFKDKERAKAMGEKIIKDIEKSLGSEGGKVQLQKMGWTVQKMRDALAKALNAVRVARNGNVVLRTVSGGTARVYEGGKVLYGGREYVAKAIGSPHMDKATLVDGAGNKIVVSLKDVDLKALNAVRNAWADAPDAATAKRDIEQTVRKATEIAKRRSGAKATYKLTPNDNYWCGYIELTFNTEEEAKKYNPYYLFNELGDNKNILPKWSWAISSFNYQKNGKVVKIFVGRLAT